MKPALIKSVFVYIFGLIEEMIEFEKDQHLKSLSASLSLVSLYDMVSQYAQDTYGVRSVSLPFLDQLTDMRDRAKGYNNPTVVPSKTSMSHHC